jgi:large subunit ribosomal protein L29
MANIVELREMSDEKLEEMLENTREELFNLRFQHASARLDDLSRLRKVRREIAQLETVLRMQELAIDTAAELPEIIPVLEDKEWNAQASFSYEDSAWRVEFLDDDDEELVTTFVNLNQKRRRGSSTIQKASG